MPVFDMLETYLVKEIKLKPSFWLRFTTRTIYVGQLIYQHLLRLCLPFYCERKHIFEFICCAALTMFIGMTFPFFGGLVGFFGGFALAPTTYFVSPLSLSLNIYL